MTNATDEFARRFWNLCTATSIPDADKARQAADLAWEAVATLQDDVGLLLNHLTRIDLLAYGAVATAVERTHAGSGRSAGEAQESAHAPLFLVPVLLAHAKGAAIPRQLGVPLPPLPDGRPIPALVDFLLAWEEVTEQFAQSASLRETLAQVREGLDAEAARARLADVFGSKPRVSGMDGFDSEQGRHFSLRFLPAYSLPADKPWYADFAERSAWQETAFKAVEGSSPTGIHFYPQTACPYATALAVAESFIVEGALRLLSREAVRVRTSAGHPQPAGDVFLFEPFGVPETGVAGHFRVSATPRGRYAEPCAQVIVRLAIAREWAFCGEAASKYAQIVREKLGRDSLVVGQIQDAELLFPDKGLHRVHALLGPSMTFSAPGGGALPLDFPETNDAAFRGLAEFERDQVPSSLEGFGKVLAAALGSSTVPTGSRASFTLQGGVWRPVMTLYLHQLRTASGERIKPPVDRAALESAKNTWCAQGGRSWVELVEAGQAA